MSSSTRAVSRLIDFVKLQGHAEKFPGFSSTLGMTWENLMAWKDGVEFEEKTLRVRMPVTNSLLLPRVGAGTKPSCLALSTCAALVDDVTTWALFLADEKRGRPGVSVSLRAQAGPALYKPITDLQSIDLVAKVNKVGKSMGFCQAHIYASHSGELVCTASHIKYLNSLGAATDFLLSSTGWPLIKMYSDYKGSPDLSSTKSMQELFDTIEYTSDTTTSIPVTPYHASIGGPIHGGAQAVLMEMAAMNAAVSQQSTAVVQSLSVEYLSSPSKTMAGLDVTSNASFDPDTLSYQVNLMNKDRISSIGYFELSNNCNNAGSYTTTASSKQQQQQQSSKL